MLRIRPNDLTCHQNHWFFRLRDGQQQPLVLDVGFGFSFSMTFDVHTDGSVMHGNRVLTHVTKEEREGTIAFSIECPDCLIAAVRQQSAAA